MTLTLVTGIVRLFGIHKPLHLLTHFIDRTSHPCLQLVYDKEVLNIAAGGAGFPISVLEDVLMSLNVSWPNDLFPVIRRIPPEFTLWISLNSTEKKNGGKNDAEMEQGGKTLGMIGRIYKRTLTCSMVSMPLVPAPPQHVVRCSEKHTQVNLINYPLCGISECGHSQ